MKNTLKAAIAAALAFVLTVTPLGVSAANDDDSGWTGDYIIPSIAAIQIVQLPKRQKYLLNEQLDLSGLRVQAVYKNSSKTELVEAKLNKTVNTSLPGVKTVQIAAKGKTDEFSVSYYQKGDVNGDFALALNDAVLLSQYIAGWQVSDKIEPICLDADGSGAVDLKDVMCITTGILA